MNSDFDIVSESKWLEDRRWRLNELILIQLLRLSDSEVRRVRGRGHVFANSSDIVNNRMSDLTVRIAFGSWEDMSDVAPLANREWLMAFDFVVENLHGRAGLHVDDPTEHPWIDKFDRLPCERIRAKLIQFMIGWDPIFSVFNELRLRTFPLSETSSRWVARV